MSSRLIYGFHAVTARLRQRPDAIHALYVLAGRQDPRARDLVARAEAASHVCEERRHRGGLRCAF